LNFSFHALNALNVQWHCEGAQKTVGAAKEGYRCSETGGVDFGGVSG